METLRLVLVFLHFVGFAALLGGLLVQVRDSDKRVLPLMRDGVGTAFVAGLLLVGVREASDLEVDNVKIAVKFTVALVVLVLVMANLRKPRIPGGLYWGLVALTLANMAVAIFWR